MEVAPLKNADISTLLSLVGLYIGMEAKKRRIKKIIVESVPEWHSIQPFQALVILRPAFFAGRRTSVIAGSTSAAGNCKGSSLGSSE
jgi:hypothetical protein